MGIFDQQSKKITQKITFVCTGNICRSAYAEKALSAKILETNPGAVTIDSAGTWGLVGKGLEETTFSFTEKAGYSTEHQAQKITPEFLENSGFLLTMESEHQKFLVSLLPRASKRIFTLAHFSRISEEILRSQKVIHSWDEFSEEVYRSLPKVKLEELTDDVDDPYRKTYEDHRKTYEKIESLLAPIVKVLKNI